MRWLRLYNDLIDNPKAQSLRGDLFKHWVNILCIASQEGKDGVLPTDRALAFRLRVRPDRIEPILNTFHERGLLEWQETATGLSRACHDYSNLQRASDDVARRVAKHRAKIEPDVTLQKRSRSRVEEDKEEDPPYAPPGGDDGSVLSGYIELLDGRFPTISANFTRLNDRWYTANWLRDVLATAEREIGPVHDADALKEALKLAFERLEESIGKENDRWPIRSRQGFGRDLIVKTLREKLR